MKMHFFSFLTGTFVACATLAFISWQDKSNTEKKPDKGKDPCFCSAVADYDRISLEDALKIVGNYGNIERLTSELVVNTPLSGNLFPWNTGLERTEISRLREVHKRDDARAIWFSLDKLKAYICAIEKQVSKIDTSACKIRNLGIRMYYGRYTGEVDEVARDYVDRHTIFMVPTYVSDSMPVRFDGDIFYRYKHQDFDPWASSRCKINTFRYPPDQLPTKPLDAILSISPNYGRRIRLLWPGIDSLPPANGPFSFETSLYFDGPLMNQGQLTPPFSGGTSF
ncbi:hypothetical protein LZZ85_12195 [Terrimonas sp. NA20]|uniref:Uncharacterized protein n=1 Tax=Terrimonas ginsenosidimutans TaxID=2908004 RepID=A0ABS9KRT3_9BACT|nr:hypothetical protein [Terrimonas ginsenosidimutans]MCG2615050.1 hypothetical protein [Terrimonas ginsenosidimutans]